MCNWAAAPRHGLLSATGPNPGLRAPRPTMPSASGPVVCPGPATEGAAGRGEGGAGERSRGSERRSARSLPTERACGPRARPSRALDLLVRPSPGASLLPCRCGSRRRRTTRPAATHSVLLDEKSISTSSKLESTGYSAMRCAAEVAVEHLHVRELKPGRVCPSSASPCCTRSRDAVRDVVARPDGARGPARARAGEIHRRRDQQSRPARTKRA